MSGKANPAAAGTRVEAAPALRAAIAGSAATSVGQPVHDDRAIVEGYRAVPEADDELLPARAAAARLLSNPDLPW